MPSPISGDGQLDIGVGAKQRDVVAGNGVPAIGRASKDVAPGTQPQHEDGDDDRRRIHGVPEHVAEDADPDDLIDEPAEA